MPRFTIEFKSILTTLYDIEIILLLKYLKI